MYSTFEFNGISKDYIRIAKGWSMPVFAPVSHSITKVAHRPGGYINETSIGIRTFKVPIVLMAHNFETREQFEEDMGSWLYTETDAPLIFSKYPLRTFYARIEGSIEFDQFHPMAVGELTFVCADPFKYGPEENLIFTDGKADINYSGTTDGLPEIEINVTDSITYLDIVTKDNTFRLGQAERIDVAPYEPTTEVANYPLTTTIGWTDATTVDNGYVSGSMAASSEGFSPASYGSTIEPKLYQGPAKRRSLPEPLQDFMMEVTLEFLNSLSAVGMIEIYLKDALGNTVMKGGLEDRWSGIAEVRGKFQVGNEGSRAEDYSRAPSPSTAWNNYKGVLRLSRIGQTLRPYFALVDEEGNHSVISSTYGWIDTDLNYQAEIVEVVIAMRIFPDGTPATMRAKNMKFIKYNAPTEGVPIIAHAGDKVAINTKTSSITINGEDKKTLKALDSRFPRLKQGVNNLSLEPASKLNGSIKYRGRYL